MELTAFYEDLDFAKDAFNRVSLIAANVAATQTLPVAGCLAAKLWIALSHLEALSTASQEDDRTQRKVSKLLLYIETVCSWPHKSEQGRHSILYNLLRPERYTDLQKAEARTRQGLVAFSLGPQFFVAKLLEKIDRFCEQVKQPISQSDLVKSKADPDAPEDGGEYPGHVNGTLYDAVQRYSVCTCVLPRAHPSARKQQRHSVRLRLRWKHATEGKDVCFDMLFAGAPSTWDYWQDLQLRVPMSKAQHKEVHYEDEAARIRTTPEVSRPIAEDAMCALVTERAGCRFCFRILGSVMHQLRDAAPAIHSAAPGPSISLRKILETYRLSNKKKLILSCIIARSFWQYYNSSWMNSKWSSDTVHFLLESSEDKSDGRELIYPGKPFFAAKFDAKDEERFPEYLDSFSVIYRYPRLLELCTLLAEIGRGSALAIDQSGSQEARMNRQWEIVKRVVDDSKPWGEFEYIDFRAALRRCLDSKSFDGLPYNPEAGDMAAHVTVAEDYEVTMRRKSLYEIVVQPLDRLLKDLKFDESIEAMDPLKPANLPPPLVIPETVSVKNAIQAATSRQGTSGAEAQRWLDQLSRAHLVLRRTTQGLQGIQKVAPVRVAVLDTGYDSLAVFFQLGERRARIKGWKDFAGTSETPVDENGHGTHTIALLMKAAPFTDVYVARVTRDRSDLKVAGGSIAQAIEWAVEQCNADIISMSFGFEEDVPSIHEAILRARLARKDQILFFAAAANSGGNSREMFPARHDDVISIRETNANGFFSETNPPVDRDGPATFGTLGKDVPSAWLSTIDGEVAKSGSSVATAVAAGIAATMLGYATLRLRESHDAEVSDDVRKLWKRRGMLAMFRKMSEDMGDRRFFLSPGSFFLARNATSRWAAIVDACNY